MEMSWITCICFICCCLFCLTSCGVTRGNTIPFLSPRNCGSVSVHRSKLTGRVIGGSDADYGEIPWQVNLIMKSRNLSYQCSGAIISEFYILTAAHCVHGTPIRGLQLVVGDLKMNLPDQYEKTFEIDQAIVHEEFGKGNKHNNDIALLKVKPHSDGYGIRFNEYVKPVCLPQKSTVADSSMECRVSGWGQINPGDKFSLSSTLRSASVTLVSHPTCQMLYSTFSPIHEGMLCAGDLEKDGVDACFGDSGGPLACKVDGRYELFGLVSWGNECAKKTQPGVYTKVQHYLSWIEKKQLHMEKGNTGFSDNLQPTFVHPWNNPGFIFNEVRGQQTESDNDKPTTEAPLEKKTLPAGHHFKLN